MHPEYETRTEQEQTPPVDTSYHSCTNTSCCFMHSDRNNTGRPPTIGYTRLSFGGFLSNCDQDAETADPGSGLDQNKEVFLVCAARMVRAELRRSLHPTHRHTHTHTQRHTQHTHWLASGLTESFVSLSGCHDAACLHAYSLVAERQNCLPDK